MDELVQRHEMIREEFYSQRLDRDPLYDMVEVPVRKRIFLPMDVDTERDGVVIGGSGALYMAGYIDDVGDIDIMSLNKERSLLWFRNGMRRRDILQSSNSYNVEDCVRLEGGGTTVLSLPRKEYRSPAEISYGADIEVTGFVVIYRNNIPHIYVSRLGLYMAMNRVIRFNPLIYHGGYLPRLAKYVGRKFRLILPHITPSNILPIDTDSLIHKDEASILFYIYILRIDEETVHSLLGNKRGERFFAFRDWTAPWLYTPRNGRLCTQKNVRPIYDVISFYRSSPYYHE